MTHDDLRTLLLETMPRKVGSEAVKVARTLLTAMFGEALKSGKVATNPASGIRLPNGQSQRADFYMASQDELEPLAGKLGPEWALTVWLMRGCGLRIGEALGVRYEDFRGDMLRVERQRLRDGSYGPLKGRGKDSTGTCRCRPTWLQWCWTAMATCSLLAVQTLTGDASHAPRKLRVCLTAFIPTTYATHSRRHCWLRASPSLRFRGTSAIGQRTSPHPCMGTWSPVPLAVRGKCWKLSTHSGVRISRSATAQHLDWRPWPVPFPQADGVRPGSRDRPELTYATSG